MTKPEAILEAIRKTDGEIIVHNNDGSIWCILKVIIKEHKETGGKNELRQNYSRF